MQVTPCACRLQAATALSGLSRFQSFNQGPITMSRNPRCNYSMHAYHTHHRFLGIVSSGRVLHQRLPNNTSACPQCCPAQATSSWSAHVHAGTTHEHCKTAAPESKGRTCGPNATHDSTTALKCTHAPADMSAASTASLVCWCISPGCPCGCPTKPTK